MLDMYLARVQTLWCNEHLLVLLVLDRIPEADLHRTLPSAAAISLGVLSGVLWDAKYLCKRCSTTWVMDDLIYNTLDVSVPLSCIQYTKSSCTLSVGIVGLED